MIQGALSRRYARPFQLAVGQHREDEVVLSWSGSPGRLKPRAERRPNNPAFAVESRKKIATEVAWARALPLVIHFLAPSSSATGWASLPPSSSATAGSSTRKGPGTGARGRGGAARRRGFQKLRAALEKISGKKIVIHQESDPGLIGGAVVHLEGKIYDGSVSTQLEKLKKQLEQSY
jgi:hypothetical protein